MNSLILPGFIPEFWKRLSAHYYWKYTLPKTTEAAIEGIRFDLSGMSVLMRNRLLQGAYEIHEASLCRKYLGPDDAVLELGAGIGFIGLFCQKVIGIKRYSMVEANPGTLELLKRNFALNGIQPTVWNFAISDSAGTVSLNVGGEFVLNSLAALSQSDASTSLIQVPSATVNELLERMPEANALVIDIEGAEEMIDFKSLPRRINKIIIELHPEISGYETTFDIVARTLACGFRVAKVVDLDDQCGSFALIRN